MRSADMPDAKRELEAFAADIKRRLDRGAEEARNPPYPKLRAAADLQDALRNESYQSLYAERNSDRVDHRKLETGLAPSDIEAASKPHSTLRQEGGLNPSPRANSITDQRNESYREGLGMTEAKRAAEIHWQNKRDAA